MKDNETAPKLIVLNGPLGIGKSTLNKMYADKHPLALSIDIDLVRMNIGQWREYPKQSAEMAWDMTIEMGRVALSSGNDVCIAQIMTREEQWQRLEKLAQETGARLIEVLLYASKDEAVRRFIKRGQAAGFEHGYRPGGLIDRNGGIKRVEEKYGEMMDLAVSRPGTIKLHSEYDSTDETLSSLESMVTELGL